MQSEIAYQSAAKLIVEAEKLAETSRTKQKLVRAAVFLLWDAVNADELATPIRWDAKLLLVQLLVQHTASFQDATSVLRSLKNEKLSPEYAIRCKLVEVELEIHQADLRRAQILSDEIYPELKALKLPGLMAAYILQRMKLGVPSDDLLQEAEDPSARALFEILLNRTNARQNVSHPELLMLDVVGRMANALKHGIEESDGLLVDNIRDMDWASLWRNGTANLVIDKELLSMSLNTTNNQLLSLLYVLLTIFHYSIDEENCSTTKSWMSEMLQHLSNFPPQRDTLAIIYFYAVLVYHNCNKPSARDILLEQMVQLDAAPDLVSFCRGVIAQQSKDFEQAMRCYDDVLSSSSSLKPAALLNMLCMAPNSVSFQHRLAAADLTAPERNILRFIKSLTCPNSMTPNEHIAAVQGLREASMSSPLERALYVFLKPGDSSEERCESYKKASVAFRHLGAVDWSDYASKLQKQNEI